LAGTRGSFTSSITGAFFASCHPNRDRGIRPWYTTQTTISDPAHVDRTDLDSIAIMKTADIPETISDSKRLIVLILLRKGGNLAGRLQATRCNMLKRSNATGNLTKMERETN
jgi:hypothetical protein